MEAREFFRKTNEICKDNDCHVCPICEHCSDGIFISADDAEELVAIVEGYQREREGVTIMDTKKAIAIMRDGTNAKNYSEAKEAKQIAVRAMEKQIPQKPVYTCNREIIHCPSCDYDLMGGVGNDEEIIHCWNCGQKLDW